MRDAFGSLISIQVILAFVLLINGYLAYSVNYTRAFRVKNGIINIIEQYEGHTEAAKDKISSGIGRLLSNNPFIRIYSIVYSRSSSAVLSVFAAAIVIGADPSIAKRRFGFPYNLILRLSAPRRCSYTHDNCISS